MIFNPLGFKAGFLLNAEADVWFGTEVGCLLCNSHQAAIRTWSGNWFTTSKS